MTAIALILLAALQVATLIKLHNQGRKTMAAIDDLQAADAAETISAPFDLMAVGRSCMR